MSLSLYYIIAYSISIYIRKFKQVGGANGKEFTERALAIILSNKFAKENTWEGKITKYKVNTMKVIEICESKK